MSIREQPSTAARRWTPWRLVRRFGLTVLGVAVLLVGVVLLAAPGPGLLVIALGLFLLGLEYEYARRKFSDVRHVASDLSRAAVARPLTFAGSVAFAFAVLAAGVVWLTVDSVPFAGPGTGISLLVSGGILLATLGFSLFEARRK